MSPRRTVAAAAALAVLAAVHLAAAPVQASCDPESDPIVTGKEHDHADASQHGTSCGIAPVAYRDLVGLVPEATMFGEVDVAGSIAVLATAFPEAGFVVFDVSDPADPRALSRWRGPVCENVVTDVDCGADVKLSVDGTVAFLAIQNISRVPEASQIPSAQPIPNEPGIIAVDLADPAKPSLASYWPIQPLGVHMFDVHRIGGVEYLFTIDNGLGVSVLRWERVEGRPVLTLAPGLRADAGGHDLFAYDDPVDKRTYLYVAAAYAGLMVYDVTNPANFIFLGKWEPPQAQERWYTHSASTFRWEGRRYTLVTPELFNGANSSAVAPVWLVDTTDHEKPALVGSWSNPGGHRARHLSFSTHNISYAGDGLMWLAHYHGGLWLLDWKPVLRGESTRPASLGHSVPSGATRPFTTSSARSRFITAFDFAKQRPSFWDVSGTETHAFASDITGGLYVFARDPG